MNNEEYRVVEDNQNYKVSATGVVISSRGKIMSQWKANTGYLKVKLYANGTKKDHYVHRLVAKAWVENPDPESLTQVMHLDDDKTNPCASNLRWGSNRENAQQAYDNGCYKFKARAYKIKTVHKITGEVRIFKSLRETGDVLGYNRKTISAILGGNKVNNFDHEFYYHEMSND